MLHGQPLIRSKRLDSPIAAEPSYAGILLPAERIVRQIVHRLIVDMRHAGPRSAPQTHAALEITREHGARKSIFGRIGDAQRILVAARANERRHRPEQLLARQRVLVVHIGKHVGGSIRPCGSPPITCRTPDSRVSRMRWSSLSSCYRLMSGPITVSG
jgi:hypothetical protein